MKKIIKIGEITDVERQFFLAATYMGLCAPAVEEGLEKKFERLRVEADFTKVNLHNGHREFFKTLLTEECK